jgi:signal transduction histidine kinase
VQAARFVRTSTFRLALLYVGLFAASVLALSVFVYVATVRFIEDQTSAAIEAEIQALSEQTRTAGLPGLVAAIEERVRRPRLGDMLYLLVDGRGRALAGNIVAWPRSVKRDGPWIVFAVERRWEGEVEEHMARARAFELAAGHRLLVGRDTRERETFGRLMVQALLWSLAAIAALGIGGGLVMSRRMLGRIDIINRVAEEIMSGKRAQRIPLSGSGDEFDRLSETLNRMLDEIEQLVASVRASTVDIAHDLRSPLTRMRNRLEMALLDHEDRDGRREAIEQAIAEADQCLATFAALLSIAEAEAGHAPAEMEPVDLGRLAADLVDLYGPLAEERGLRLSRAVDVDAVVTGNRQLLFQAVSNLLDNAIKYTGPGGSVEVAAGPTAEGAEIAVGDTGPGISEGERERAIERFVRLDHGRATSGSGLGLSVVAAIARMHGAELVLDDNRARDNESGDNESGDNPPGLRATLRFPRESVSKAEPLLVPATTDISEKTVDRRGDEESSADDILQQVSGRGLPPVEAEQDQGRPEQEQSQGGGEKTDRHALRLHHR